MSKFSVKTFFEITITIDRLKIAYQIGTKRRGPLFSKKGWPEAAASP